MKPPVIGVTRDWNGSGNPDRHYDFYAQSILNAGGVARGICYGPPDTALDALVGLDGLLFTGGDDLDPSLWGEPWHPMAVKVDPRRQAFELALLRRAESRRLPILGICLGCQLINVYRGGTLIQFLPDYPRANPIEHRRVNDTITRHEVHLEQGSKLSLAIGKSVINVNSYHKQSIARTGERLRITAHALDGVVESIEDPDLPLLVGVQWHPERISNEPDQRALFQMLVTAAAVYASR